MRHVSSLRSSRVQLCLIAAAVAAGQASMSFAGIMTINANGVTAGFTAGSTGSLQTFADGIGSTANDPVNGLGAVGVTFDSTQTWVTQFGNGVVYAFPNDSVGSPAQHAANIFSNSYNSSAAAMGLTTLGGHIYMASDFNGGNVGELISPPSYNYLVKANIPNPSGIAASDVHGTVYVAIGGSTVDNAPVSPSVIEYVGSSLQDGTLVSRTIAIRAPNSSSRAGALALSGDQSSLYVLWDDGHIINYSTTQNDAGGNPIVLGDVFDLPTDPTTHVPIYENGITGLVAGTGTFSNDLFLDGTDGNLYMINLTNSTSTIIASGGSVGGYLSTDPYDGSLFITQSDRVLRLTAPAGAGFAFTAAPPAVPEPASVSLLGLGAVGLLARRRRQAC